ncbi:MAG: hypothetical protein RL514_2853 [Verrucomicrobiota bacterium]|jgi:hypothetical protein
MKSKAVVKSAKQLADVLGAADAALNNQMDALAPQFRP